MLPYSSSAAARCVNEQQRSEFARMHFPHAEMYRRSGLVISREQGCVTTLALQCQC